MVGDFLRGAVGVVGAVLLVLMLVALPVRAAEDPEQLIRQGVALRRAGDNLKAQGYFQRAYQLAQTPRSAAQLGLVEQALNQWTLADAHLSEALAAPNDLWIKSNAKALNDSLANVRTHLGRITVTGAPAGARVRIGGVERGALPLATSVYVEPGALTVDVEATGYQPAHRSLTAVAGKEEAIEISLTAVAVASAVSADATPATPAAPATTPAVVVVDQPGSARAWQRPAAWIAGGLGAALLVGGTVALLASNSKYTDFNDQKMPGTTQPLCRRKAADAGGGSCAELLAAGDRDKTLAVIGFVGAGVLAAASATLFVLSAQTDEKPSGGAVACAPTLGGGVGGVCQVRF